MSRDKWRYTDEPLVAQSPPGSPAELATSGPLRSPRMRILVVDDNVDAAQSL